MIMWFAAAVLLLWLAPDAGASIPQVCHQESCVQVELAVSGQALERGLSGREGLADDEGMLFVFAEPGQYGFWMKDMKFNLDIVWLDAQGKIVDIKERLKPCTPDNCPVYKPYGRSMYVLEVNAGYCRKHGIMVGDILNLNNMPR